MRKLALPEEILLSIQQPARYIGGEVNMVKKDPSAVDVRFAMCFPDVYDKSACLPHNEVFFMDISFIYADFLLFFKRNI